MSLHELDDDWPVVGEVISDDPNFLLGPAREYFDQRRQAMSNGLREDHEVATVLDEELVPAQAIKLKADRRRSTVRAKAHEVVDGHKKEIAATTLTVAGVLLAAHHMRVRRKK